MKTVATLQQHRQTGFSLFELMIAVAVVGILSAVALPAYQSYIDTAAMTRVVANFEQGVRVAQGEFTKRKTRVALGINASVPDTTEDWVALLNTEGVLAPGGGPAYIPSKNKKNQRGDAISGAIGVDWNDKKQRLRLWRPLYLSLVEQRADLTSSSLEIKNQREP